MPRCLLVTVLFTLACTRSNVMQRSADLSTLGGGPDLSAAIDLSLTSADLAVQGNADLAAPGDDMAAPNDDLAGDDLAGDDLASADLSAADLQTADLRMRVDLRSTDLATGCVAAFQEPQTSYALYAQPLMSNVPSAAPVTLTIPDGYRVHGTVTLTGGLGMVGNSDGGPSSLTFDSGEVVLTNGDTGERFPGINITFSPPSSFTYEAVVPGGSYQMRVQFRVKVTDPEHPGFDTTVTRLLEIPSLVVCGDTPKDVTLAALPSMVLKRVRVSGVAMLDPIAQGLGLRLETANGQLTISKFVNRIDDGAPRNVLAADNLPLPEGETFFATLEPFHNPDHLFGETGYDTRLAMNDALVVGSNPEPFAVIALPPVQTISGSVGNAFNQLFPVGTDESFFTHSIFCDVDRNGTRILETSLGFLFTDLLSYKFYVRSGASCRITGVFVVGTPSPGMLPTTPRENSYALLFSPANAANEAISAPLTRNFTVPNLGTQIKVAVVVKDVRGAVLSGYNAFFESESLADANLADRRIRSQVVSDANGTGDVHVLPGSYTIVLRK